MLQMNVFPLDASAVIVLTIMMTILSLPVVPISYHPDHNLDDCRDGMFRWGGRVFCIGVAGIIWCASAGSSPRVDIASSDIPISEIRRSDGSTMHVYQTDDGVLHNFERENGRCPMPGESIRKVTTNRIALGLKWDDKIEYRANHD